MATFRILRSDYQTDPSVLVNEGLLLGRAAACDLQLNHPSVQPFHAGLKLHHGAYWLSALAEPAPLLNGEPIQHAQLGAGDTLRLGAYRLHCSAIEQLLQITVEFLLEPASPVPDSPAPKELTPTEATALSDYWTRRLQIAAAAQTVPPVAPDFAWQPSADLRRRWPWSLAAGSLLFTTILAVLAAFVFPRTFAPGELSAAHTRKTLDGSVVALRTSGGACTSCHTPISSLQKNCASCHTTQTFQAALGAAHLKLGLTCRACHAEHRGSAWQPAAVANAVCTHCHQPERSAAAGPAANSPHRVAVRYPVKNGFWSWEGLSQAEWQRRNLPRHTADYNLREQFHMLHAEGRAQGRAQCGDCHLGGTQGKQLWHNVRESCAQCHRLHPELAAELAQMAAANTLQQGHVRCVACHAQHGAEKDLRASTRK